MTAFAREHLTISAYGVQLRVVAPNRHLLELMTDRLPPGWQPSLAVTVDREYELVPGAGAASDSPCLLIDGGLAAHRPGLDGVLEAVGADSQVFVAEMAPGLVFVHAGVVGWHGRAVVVAGASWSGKTTLVAELVRAGATYYSDEYAVLDEQGCVHPYPQPLAIREPDRRLRLDAADLGGTVGTCPLPVGLALVSTYREGAQWQPTVLSGGRAVLALVAHTVSFRRQPAAALRALERVVATATVLDGVRGAAAEVARQILDGDRRVSAEPVAARS